MNLADAQQSLLLWFKDHQRELPWRASRDPYRIWISETMLQQTTTTAVIPYFENFIARFPDLETLANAPIEHVLEAWAGLGYYSRARNLHKSAKALYDRGGFPRSFEDLIELPGFGPYTARSVASLAFDQSVGVVDGNVIRVFARLYAQNWEWWQSQARKTLQALADEWVKEVSPYQMNQALMELGRTVCTPKSPSCLLCPVRAFCKAARDGEVTKYPLPKPRRAREIWLWEPQIEMRQGRIRIAINPRLPFLKNQWLLPGTAQKVNQKPKSYDFKHTITHHDIFVTIARRVSRLEEIESKWIPLKEIKQHVPVSLVQKALAYQSRADSGSLRLSPQNRSAARKGGRKKSSGGRRTRSR